MRNYRCKHTVEAMQWVDTDANREIFTDWFDDHDEMFGTLGSTVVLPCGDHIQENEWIVWSHGEFIGLFPDDFAEQYEAVP